MTREAIRFWRHGQPVEISSFHPRTTLLDYLRLDQRHFGTKEGCAEGDCGACTVALGRLRDGRVHYEPVNACILLLGQIDGLELVTVEDLAGEGALHPVQAAMVENHGSQCGFCTPGIVMSLFALYQEGERPVGRESVNDALAGNLCRCTGYRPIVDAALQACAEKPAGSFADESPRVSAALARFDDGQDLFVGDATQFFASPAGEATLRSLYAAHPDAVLVGGSTDVGLWATKNLDRLDKVIWLGRVKALRGIDDTPAALTLGAMVSHAGAFAHLSAIDPDIGEIMRRFGSAQVRASGTVGGNIANGSPIGDLAPVLIALGSTLELARTASTRTIPLESFFVTYRKQDRQAGEYVRRIVVPKLKSHEAFRAYKVTKRFDEDISAVLGAFKFSLNSRTIASARVAFGGMAGIPKQAPETEAALVGVSLDDAAAWGEALSALALDYQPLDDHRASAAYRATIARNLLFKALSETASGDTRATRIVGHRDVPQAEACNAER